MTQTGLGTFAAEGKRTLEIEGRTFLLELPLSADFLLISARQHADRLRGQVAMVIVEHNL